MDEIGRLMIRNSPASSGTRTSSLMGETMARIRAAGRPASVIGSAVTKPEAKAIGLKERSPLGWWF